MSTSTPVPQFNSDHFTFHEGKLVAEASSLGMLAGMGMPVSINIRSVSTGTVQSFVLVTTERNGEQEITGWHYRPVDRTLALQLAVVIFND